MSIQVRRAQPADAQQMSDLLNEIIAIGGTTAFLDPIAPETLQGWMAAYADRSLWHVAEDEQGLILGYQSAEVAGAPAPDALNMASFVRVGIVGKGIGSRLFEATTTAARAMGYSWLNASIRSDNTSGLSYYSKVGFVTWDSDPEAVLSDGRKTGKTHKRYDL